MFTLKTINGLHYKISQLHLQLRMKLTKIHRVLVFKQSQWLKPYIDFNTKKSKQAIHSFEKDSFKLMSNSVYDKVTKNIR